MSGAYNGFAGIPERWVNKTKDVDQILSLVEQMEM
jgi:hypothetical protein